MNRDMFGNDLTVGDSFGTPRTPLTATTTARANPILKTGDWVLYRGRPRQVSKFLPYNFPELEVEADSRYDMVELEGLTKSVYVRDVQIMRIEEPQP